MIKELMNLGFEELHPDKHPKIKEYYYHGDKGDLYVILDKKQIVKLSFDDGKSELYQVLKPTLTKIKQIINANSK